jgi:heme/copper-type cytochrome/quinol oxidase subunit 2
VQPHNVEAMAVPGTAFRVWFRIDENGQHVHLLYIEPIAE